MSEITQKIIAAAIAAVITASIGIGGALYIRRKNAKAVFRTFVKAKISELPKVGLREFYNLTKRDVGSAVHTVGLFLSSKQETRLDGLWKEYDEIDDEQLDHWHEGSRIPLAKELHKLANMDFESSYDLLKYYLDEFYKL